MATLLPQGVQPQFSAHICCGQVAAWIKMSLDVELDLGPGDFVLDGDPAPSPKGRRAPSSILRVVVENFEIGPEVGGTSGCS